MEPRHISSPTRRIQIPTRAEAAVWFLGSWPQPALHGQNLTTTRCGLSETVIHWKKDRLLSHDHWVRQTLSLIHRAGESSVQVGIAQEDLRKMLFGILFTLRIRRIPREHLDRIQALPGRFRFSVLFELTFYLDIFFGTKSIWLEERSEAFIGLEHGEQYPH